MRTGAADGSPGLWPGEPASIRTAARGRNGNCAELRQSPAAESEAFRDFCPLTLRGRLTRDDAASIGERGSRATRVTASDRSEERRVGKECRSRWAPDS